MLPDPSPGTEVCQTGKMYRCPRCGVLAPTRRQISRCKALQHPSPERVEVAVIPARTSGTDEPRTAVTQNLCDECGHWHDHTGRPLVAVIDWQGKEWRIPKGHKPYDNTDDSGGRLYHSNCSNDGILTPCRSGTDERKWTDEVDAVIAQVLGGVLAEWEEGLPVPMDTETMKWLRDPALRDRIRSRMEGL